ncbi:uncharacterized protein PHALS_05187 [Plasmopara halstedii]|uniref:Uncharacterized protein n=1 Tax=Plasmopara halstedii TaxID=4781 RepID=A0A0N7L7S1_PLAHL|nr:uncharacterized protein PHALS_05187 [Plasmopara halstedii]CEG47859.1 hypothetical protein PHALS_05187 [Plasmopara halstedii]|eukprot:XP_024584228.1 hypothetical protein PHALS_05187 [Plasmopara halstedii]
MKSNMAISMYNISSKWIKSFSAAWIKSVPEAVRSHYANFFRMVSVREALPAVFEYDEIEYAAITNCNLARTNSHPRQLAGQV